MSDQEIGLVMVLMMVALGGPAMALAYRLPRARRTFEKRKAMFVAGRLKRDPEQEPMGPHRSFLRNMIGGFVLFAVISGAMLAGVRLAAG